MNTKMKPNNDSTKLTENEVIDLQSVVKLIEVIVENPIIIEDNLVLLDEITATLGILHNSLYWKIIRAAKQGVIT